MGGYLSGVREGSRLDLAGAGFRSCGSRLGPAGAGRYTSRNAVPPGLDRVLAPCDGTGKIPPGSPSAFGGEIPRGMLRETPGSSESPESRFDFSSQDADGE
jgi:hypothetical protein